MVMFFGLTNSLATFQAMINKLLRDLTNMEKIGSFINDIVGTEMEEGYNELVIEILRRLEENNLYVKPEKCKQKVKEVDLLEVVIGLEGIKMKEEKVKVVLDQPVSKSVKNIQKFLGLANYYRRFIEEFAKIARLLHELTRKEQKQKQKIRQEKSFEVLKKRFTMELILVVPDLNRKIRMEVDVSDYTIEEVLSMECSDRKQRLVVYFSKSFNEIERNYEIYNKEILMMIRGLENWRYLLEDTKFKFKVWTNHKNLEYFIKAQKLN